MHNESIELIGPFLGKMSFVLVLARTAICARLVLASNCRSGSGQFHPMATGGADLETTISDLRRDLLAFDGRNLTVLGEIAAHHEGDIGYLDGLVALADATDGRVFDGATWLLKAYLEAGGELTKLQCRMLISKLETVENWTTQLHLCQVVRYLSPNRQEAQEIVRWLLPLLSHDRPFLRAWSLDALYHVSARYSAYANRAEEALNSATRDPAASVRARAKNLRTSFKPAPR